MAGTLYVGTSGFAFPGWKGPFYPERTSGRNMLPFYATRFPTVEINYTFRRDPSPATLEGWRSATPDGFRFALKANQRITHFFRLGNLDVAREFVGALGPLGDRIGPILYQCPPNMKRDPGRLEAFLDALPDGFRYAFEFRHPSWADDRGLLADRGAAWVVSDTDEQPWTEDGLGEAPFAYLRLRRPGYGAEEIRTWGERIQRSLRGGTDVFCYVKHEEDATGPLLAAELIEAAR